MKRLLALGAGLLLLVAGCGGDNSTSSTTDTSATAESTATSQAATTLTTEATTTTAAGSTSVETTAAPTTTEATTATNAPVEAAPLDDGRPATFVAITDDYVAVEVDTVSGEVLHVYGQAGSAADVAAAEEMSPNVLVGVWRLRGGDTVGISDCCEPAAGNVFFLAADGELSLDPYANDLSDHGWSLAPSPTAEVFANLGYSLIVTDPTVTADTGSGEWIDDPGLGFPSGGPPAWSRDGSELFWTTHFDGGTALATLDLAEGSPSHVAVLEWVADNQTLAGIGSQASGDLVGFLHTRSPSYEITATEGVVFSTDGALLASFPIEKGAVWGGYDPAGVFLVYVDADGTVRWQGGGAVGEIADGFLFASW